MDEATDIGFMRQALAEARAAGARGEVPVGAVLVRDGVVLAAAGDGPVGACDPSAHAEVRALRAAGARVGNYRLPGTTLYVTLEPCAMCVGALVHARVERLVFGAGDPKSGAAGGAFDLAGRPEHNHRLAVSGGVLGDTCGDVLRAFFRARRGESRRCG
ncbi:MAG: tRNA adenosine(34) deaminase TadA [Halofilum sp. (in: g-proteobacteria)]|nr:tRNA adenosine(34) deaminase TadA [Halofilum sp. (in: g-proteobacteria)]